MDMWILIIMGIMVSALTASMIYDIRKNEAARKAYEKQALYFQRLIDTTEGEKWKKTEESQSNT